MGPKREGVGRCRVVLVLLCAIGTSGCFVATTLVIGRRYERGYIRSPDDVMCRADRLIVTGFVETAAPGSVSACRGVMSYHLITTGPDRFWWAEMSVDDFLDHGWPSRSLVTHEGPLPADVRREARVVPLSTAAADDAGCGIRQSSFAGRMLELRSTSGQKRSMSTTYVPLRSYRTHWSWPIVVLGMPLAVALDVATFPVQYYLCSPLLRE